MAPTTSEPSGEVGSSVEAQIGRVLDRRYRIDSVLGVGGLGAVFRAEHLGLRRPVAVKVLHERFGMYEEFRRRFEREAQVLSALQHDHIVGVSDFGTDEGTPYLVMELLEGRTLGGLIRDEGPPEPEVAVSLTRQVLEALAFAHEKGVLHRDLQPANVFLVGEPEGGYRVKILDFGLAKLVTGADGAPDSTLTADGTILGTPSYMSPEQAAGSASDARSDVYSAGVVLYELLCGRCPFVGKNQMEVLRGHLAEEVPPPTELRPGLWLSPPLEQLLSRALAKKREERFADGGELLRALDALPSPAARYTAPAGAASAGAAPARDDPRENIGSEPTVPVTPSMKASVPSLPSSLLQTWRTRVTPGRRRVLAGVGGLAVTGAIIAAGVLASGTGESEPPADGASGDAQASGAAAGAEADGEGAAGEQAAEAEGDDSEAQEPPAPRPPARDPFAEPPRERLLRPAYAWVRRERELGREHIRKLQEYQREHRDDPRPSLLLAHDFAQRDWLSDALTRYELAYRLDASVRGSPWMRGDLVRMAATASHGKRAAALIDRVYGDEAVGAIERALERGDLSAGRARRLRKLRARLADTEDGS